MGESGSETRSLGHFEIVEEIGRGGMGVVYRARDTKLDRIVACKVLPDQMTKDPERRHRMMREARAAAQLSQPNVATIFEVQEQDDDLFIAMEYVEGESLRAKLAAGRLSIDETVEFALQIAEALSHAHDKGIVHRDLKPENVVVRPDGLVKVLDFGLAKWIDTQVVEEVAESMAAADTLQREFHTEEGRMLGTPGYMSPEQSHGQKVDARTDIFSLGTMLYEMLTGIRPFQGSTPMATLVAMHEQEQEPLENVDATLPAELVRITEHCMAYEQEDRYGTVDELAADLVAFQREFATPTRSNQDPSVLAETIDAASPTDNRKSGDDLVDVSEANHTTKTEVSEATRSKRPIVLVSLGAALLAFGALAVWNAEDETRGATESASTTAYDQETDSADTPDTRLEPVEHSPQLSPTPIEGAEARFGYPMEVSPKGNYLAYSSIDAVHIQTLETGDTTSIERNGDRRIRRLSWFPDGTRLLVTLVTDSDQWELWTLHLLEQRWKRILTDAGWGRVAPNGRRIAFVIDSDLSVASPDGTNVRKVGSIPETGTLTEFEWANDETLLAGIGPDQTDLHGQARIVAIDTRSGESSVLLEDSSLRITGPLEFTASENRLTYVWLPHEPKPQGVQIRSVQFGGADLTFAGRPRILLDQRDEKISFAALSSPKTDHRLYFKRNTREWRNFLLDTTSTPDEFAGQKRLSSRARTGDWLTEDAWVFPRETERGTQICLENLSTGGIEVLARFDERISDVDVGPNESLYAWVPSKSNRRKGRMVWFEDFRRLENRTAVTGDNARRGREFVECTASPDARCYFFRANAGRIEVYEVTEGELTDEPLYSLQSPGPNTEIRIDVRRESPSFLLAHRNRVVWYSDDGAKKRTWRAANALDAPPGGIRLLSVQSGPSGGIYLSGAFPRRPRYRIIHVDTDGEVTTLRESESVWLAGIEASPGRRRLKYGALAFTTEALQTDLPVLD